MNGSGAGVRLRSRRRCRALVFLVPGLLVLGACEMKSAPATVASERLAAPQATPSAPVVADPKPSAPAQVEPAATLAARPPAAVPGPPPTLVGMSREDVTELLGPPMFRRRETPAEIWQYRTQTCTLDLFLYKDANSESYRVTHVEARGKNGAKVGPSDCLGRFMTPERKTRAG
jgi:hypothetical protein